MLVQILRRYYVCPVEMCAWSGSSRSRHALSRPTCKVVPLAFRYFPGTNVGALVKIARNDPRVRAAAIEAQVRSLQGCGVAECYLVYWRPSAQGISTALQHHQMQPLVEVPMRRKKARMPAPPIEQPPTHVAQARAMMAPAPPMPQGQSAITAKARVVDEQQM